MRHLKKGKKFHRKKGQRTALLKGLLNNLILKEKIQTTETKAKTLKSKAEKLITIAKKQNLSAFRTAASRLSNKKSAYKLYHDIAPRYSQRQGGYLRVIKSAKLRKGDGAKMAVLEFV
ncbi:50S ribosomal protein L17 [Candidatus Wolfebacteria bacterium]|nr:50S ribosomal protein L17 [Candidatus Wolfebacteria bacterium]